MSSHSGPSSSHPGPSSSHPGPSSSHPGLSFAHSGPSSTHGGPAPADGGPSRHGDVHAVTPGLRVPLTLVAGLVARDEAAEARGSHQDISLFPG
ncbi:hypothetical protein [Streptomyces tuirus]